HERKALAERAAGVEVGRERDHGSGVDERAGGRHRPAEEERTRREEHRGDVARRKHPDALGPGGLEMVDGARAELDRERYRTELRELVAVEAELEPVRAAGLQVASSLVRVERAAFQE